MPIAIPAEEVVHTDEARVVEADDPDRVGNPGAQFAREGREAHPARAFRAAVQRIDAERLIGLAAHRAAAARIEQIIARRVGQIRPEDRSDLRPPRQNEARSLAKAAIAAQIRRGAQTRSRARKPEERGQPDLGIKTLGRVGGIVAPVPGQRRRQREPAVVGNVAIFIDIRPGNLDLRLAHQPIAEDVLQTEAYVEAAQIVVFLVLLAQRRLDEGVGVGIEGRGPVDPRADLVIRPFARGADPADLGIEAQTLAAVEQVAMQPVAAERDPVDAVHLGAEAKATLLFLDHGQLRIKRVSRRNSL